MAKVKKQTVQTEGMQKQIAELRLEISKLSIQLSKAQLKNTTQLRSKKDELARLLTGLSMQKFVEKSEEKEEAK